MDYIHCVGLAWGHSLFMFPVDKSGCVVRCAAWVHTARRDFLVENALRCCYFLHASVHPFTFSDTSQICRNGRSSEMFVLATSGGLGNNRRYASHGRKRLVSIRLTLQCPLAWLSGLRAI